MNLIPKSIQKIGMPVSITHQNTVQHGFAVLYPVRYQQKSMGNIAHTPHGHTDSGRFMMFAETTLLENAVYGDTVSDGVCQYMLLWVDVFHTRCGSYAKACIKIMTNGGVSS